MKQKHETMDGEIGGNEKKTDSDKDNKINEELILVNSKYQVTHVEKSDH